MRVVPVLSVVVLLAACGDPLAGVDRLGDVDVAETDPAAAVLPSSQEVAREGFFGTSAATDEAVSAAVADTPAVAAPAETGGFLRKLVQRAAEANPEAVAAAQAEAVTEQAEGVADIVQTDGNVAAAAAVEPVIIETRPTVSASVETAALSPEAIPEARQPRRLGLFGNRSANRTKARTGPDAQDVPYGTVLPFGQIARVCEAKGKNLGTKVEGTGRRGFALYDSNAGNRTKHTFYITGFSDNCPRQFTAANALLGAPTFYEEIRFGPAGKHLPYAETDKAYDGVKTSVCRVGKNKPCGKQIGKLDSSTVFVSAYEFGEFNGKWKEFLVHDGKVLASAVK